MTTKRTIGLSAAFALASGAAMAAPPSGFSYNDFTVADGVVTGAACPTGYTCQNVLSEAGFLQQRMSDGTADGTFFRTIVVDEDATAADQTEVELLGFRMDTFAGAPGLAVHGSVSLDGDTGTGALVTTISQDDWNDGTEPSILIEQNQDLGDRTIAFSFEMALDNSTRMRMDQMNPTGNSYSGPMTVRRLGGSFVTCDEVDGVGCVLELPDGQTLTYNTGDTIGTMYQHQSLFGMGDIGAENRVFENQTFEVNGEQIGWTNVNNTVDDSGGGSVTFNTINTDGGAWDYWDPNFGAAPLGVTPPATFPADPFDP